MAFIDLDKHCGETVWGRLVLRTSANEESLIKDSDGLSEVGQTSSFVNRPKTEEGALVRQIQEME